MVLSRYAPKDSKWNDIEREWGPHTKKMAGKVLPAIQPDEDLDEAEDRSIKELIDDCFKDLKYDGFPVHSVHVPCVGNDVVINGETYSNEYCSQEDVAVIEDIFQHKR